MSIRHWAYASKWIKLRCRKGKCKNVQKQINFSHYYQHFPFLSLKPKTTKTLHTTLESRKSANPRPIPAEIKSQSPAAPPNLELPVHFPRPMAGRHDSLREAPGDGVLSVDALGRLLCLEYEQLEAVVGAPPSVLPDLAGGHALGKTVKVAPAEGKNWHRRTMGDGGGKAPDRLGSWREERLPWKAGGHNRHRKLWSNERTRQRHWEKGCRQSDLSNQTHLHVFFIYTQPHASNTTSRTYSTAHLFSKKKKKKCILEKYVCFRIVFIN